MKRKIISSFFDLPFTGLSESSSRASESKQHLFSRIVIDILDDELWESKVSILGNSLIIIAILTSTLDYILSNGEGGFLITSNPVKYVIASFFIIEFILRIYYSKSLGFKSPSQLNYLFSFLGLIDLLSLTPLLLDIFAVPFISG